MKAKPFVCVPKDGRLSSSYGVDLGARGYRLTFDCMLGNQPDYLRAIRAAGLETLLTGDTDTFPDVDWQAVRENPYDDRLYLPIVEATIRAVYAISYRGLVDYLHVWNEFDGDGPESSRMPAQVVNEIARLWRQAFPGVQIIHASSVSGDVSRLDELDIYPNDLIAVDPYAKAPDYWDDPMTGRLSEFLDAVRARYPNNRLAIPEIGLSSRRNVDDPASEDGDSVGTQSSYCYDVIRECIDRDDLELVSWYALHNWGGFGLLDDDNEPKLSYYYFRDAAQYWVGDAHDPGPEPIVDDGPRYVAGFARIADLYPELVGSPIENENGLDDGIADQLTATGTLLYVARHGADDLFAFTDRRDGTRYKWRRDELGL